MKKLALSIAVLATFAIASCGGSSGTTPTPGPTPTATDTNTKAVSETTVQATGTAAFGAAEQGLQNLGPVASTSVSTTGKETVGAEINYTYSCTLGGTVLATGMLTAQCTESGTNWSCSSMVMDLDLLFTGCMETATVDSMDYTVTLNGPAVADLTGTASGSGETGTVDVSGTSTGTLTATGDANGTVELALGIAAAGPFEDPGPTVTCSGTASVVSDEVTQVCGVTATCDGCTQ